METTFARLARKRNLSDLQCDLIVASLLGDGHLTKTTRGYAFRVNHGRAQKDYVDWKYQILKDFVNSPPAFAKKCYYFRTITHQTFKQLRKQFYNNNRITIVPRKLVKKHLTPFILAVWIMDDGTREGKQLRINSQSFNKSENLFLQRLLKTKLGIEATLNQDKGKYRLRIAKQSMSRLIQLVKPHIIPSMSYKLSRND